MNAIEILAVAAFIPAGILAATFTTIFCMVRQAREKRDHELFDAYVHRPRELETWLVRGALEHIQHAMTFDKSRR